MKFRLFNRAVRHALALALVEIFAPYFSERIAGSDHGAIWKGATELGALAGAIGSVVLSVLFRFAGMAALTAIPFKKRMAIVFGLSLLLTVVVSWVRPAPHGSNRITMAGVNFATSGGFSLAAVVILSILVGLYTVWW